MTEKILYWVTVVSAWSGLILFVSNAGLMNGNLALQADINQRRVVVDMANKVLPLSQQLSNALYEGSVKTGDAKLRDLLVSQGFTLPDPKAATAEKPAKETAKKPAKDKIEE